MVHRRVPRNRVDGPERSVASTLVGTIRMADPKTLVITELRLVDGSLFVKFTWNGQGRKEPDDVRTMGTESTVDIQITLHKDTAAYYAEKKQALTPDQFEELLVKDWKLSSKMSMRTTMAYLLNKDNIVTGYTIQSILETHAAARLELYKSRKQAILNGLTKDIDTWSVKARFVQCLLNDELIVRKRPLAEVQADMTTLGFDEKAHDMLLSLSLKVQTKEMVEAWESRWRI